MLSIIALAVLSLRLFEFGTQTQDVEYEAFMKLTLEQKRSTFAALTPGNKATLIRRHAQRWLERYRSELTPSQVAVVEEAIAVVSPAFYSNPADPALSKNATELRAKLACSLGRARVQQAFTFLGPAGRQTWTDLADDWLWWLSECVVQ